VCRCVGMQSEYHWPGYTVIVLPRRKPQLSILSWKLDEVLKLTLLHEPALIALQFRFQRSILFFFLNGIPSIIWLNDGNVCLSVRMLRLEI